mgnify:CR=1 FL=1
MSENRTEERLDAAAARRPGADRMGCANVAHAFAGMPANDKFKVVAERAPREHAVDEARRAASTWPFRA